MQPCQRKKRWYLGFIIVKKLPGIFPGFSHQFKLMDPGNHSSQPDHLQFHASYDSFLQLAIGVGPMQFISLSGHWNGQSEL